MPDTPTLLQLKEPIPLLLRSLMNGSIHDLLQDLQVFCTEPGDDLVVIVGRSEHDGKYGLMLATSGGQTFTIYA